ncbi:MAG: hypothetical protein BGO49_17185 [Planctomycetales bacterium 71-10]|nr:MAG: hypothetical protein BGO49_17185 [Planctomycetales bacterium 71-10]
MDAYKDSALRRFAKGAVLALGFGTIWAAVVFWLGSTVLYNGIGQEVPRAEMIQVASDGTPRIDSYPFNDYSQRSSRDLEGREIPNGSTAGDIIQYLYLAGEPRSWPAALAGPPWTSRIKPFFNERDPKAIWYFILDGGSGRTGSFVGYERVSNRRIGYLGMSGFRTTPVPLEERIPSSAPVTSYIQWGSSVPASVYSLSSPSLGAAPSDVPPRLAHIFDGNILRVVDLADGSVRTAFESPEPIVSLAIPYLFSYFGQGAADEKGATRAILVRTPGKVFRLDHAYNVIGTFVIPPEVPPNASLNWYEARDGSAVVTFEPPTPAETVYDNQTRNVTLYQVAADGAIRKATTVELANGSPLASGRAMLGLTAAAIPAPVPLLVVEAAAASNDSNRNYPAALGAILRASIPGLIAVAVLATALAVAAWRRARAFGLPANERAGWAAFVGLFGLPGWVGFRLHRRWPARAACPRCGARAPRDRPSCLACGEAFPAPAATGIEIFA